MQLPTTGQSGSADGGGRLLPPTTTTTTTTSTYTSIPISISDVISRSYYNFSSFLSLRRPWPEFIATDVFDRPDSLSNAGERIRKNANYFRLNYGILIFTITFIYLIGTPVSLILLSAIFALWLLLYVFREDPLFFMNNYLSDRTILVGLILVSVITLWLTGIVESLIVGVGIGLIISAVHGGLRNPDGLFLNEDDAASSGLIGSTSHSNRRIG